MRYFVPVVLVLLALGLLGIFRLLPHDAREIKFLPGGEITMGSAEFSGYFSAREKAIIVPAKANIQIQRGSVISFEGRVFKVLGTKRQDGPWVNPEAHDEEAYRLPIVKIFVE